jgi:transaldolase/glucose-6-phosphate isomerase
VDSETRVVARLDAVADAVGQARRLLLDERAIERLNARDAALWSTHPETRRQIADSLGWLDVVGPMSKAWPDLVRFRREARQEGYTHAVLLGMGGSSLISILWTHVFQPGPDGLTLSVLDSTHPDTVKAVHDALPIGRTLFLVASKSGTTTEPNAYHRYFWRVVEQSGRDPRAAFVAITDPGTSLADEATRERWRHVFLNPPDIGGRYSALSLFGLVPAALMDLPGDALLARAAAMREALRAGEDNPGLMLGSVLGGGVQAGRNKLTLVFTPRLAAFATWLEQLLAESTGKAGTGVIPVTEPDLGDPAVYGADRLLVRARLADDPPDDFERRYAAIPSLTLTLPDPLQLGAEFLRWEAATALAGRVLGINPFDQPNVQESKDNTRDMLEQFQRAGALPEVEGVPTLDVRSPALAPLLTGWLTGLGAHEYVAVMAYLPYGSAVDERLTRLQTTLRNGLKVAVTLGYGPRFLHSTGQLHKGGPPIGRFLQIVGAPDASPALVVPGFGYTFNTLVAAQARGDLQALAARKRPVMAVSVGADAPAGLDRLLAAVADVVG